MNNLDLFNEGFAIRMRDKRFYDRWVETKYGIRRPETIIHEGTPITTKVLAQFQSYPTQEDKPSHKNDYTIQDYTPIMTWAKRKGLQLSTVANTNSMEPFIDANSLVLSKPETDEYWERHVEDPKWYLGNVIIFHKNNLSIIHRIIGVDWKKKRFLTRGDNNYRDDGWTHFVYLQRSYVMSLPTTGKGGD